MVLDKWWGKETEHMYIVYLGNNERADRILKKVFVLHHLSKAKITALWVCI